MLEEGRVDSGDVEVGGESEHAAEEGAGVLEKAGGGEGGGGDLGTGTVLRDDGKGALFHPLDDVKTGAGVAVACDESVGRRPRSGRVGNLFTSDGGVVKEQAFRQREQFGFFADVEGGGGSPAKPLGDVSRGFLGKRRRRDDLLFQYRCVVCDPDLCEVGNRCRFLGFRFLHHRGSSIAFMFDCYSRFTYISER